MRYEMNDFIEPMLASKPKSGIGIADFSSADYVLEEKFDGHRLIVKKSGELVQAWSRVGNSRELHPRILAEIRRSLPNGTFDGELYLPGGTSTDVTTIETLGRLELIFFDLLRIGEASAMEERGADRRRLLERAMQKIDGTILRLAEQLEPSEEALHEMWNRGGEGAILKRRDTKYRAGARSRDWIKIKKAGAASFVLTGFESGLNGPFSRMIGVAEGRFPISVKTLNREWLRRFALDPKRYIGSTVLFDFQNRTSDGNFRHPMVDRFETDGLTPR